LYDDWLVDLREDVFLDALFSNRIHPDQGKLYIVGPLRWIINGSQMRLALVDSDLYRAIVQADALRQMPHGGKIKVKDLVVGGVYTSDNGIHGVAFLGPVRINGRKLLAWMNLAMPKPPHDMQNQIDMQFAGSNYCMVTGSCSYTKQIDRVIIPTIRPYQAVNGYGFKIAETIEWL
jgi:hypothetical protein